MEFYAEFISIVLDTVAAGSTHFEEVIDFFFCYDAIGIIDVAIRTRKSNDFGTELGSFLADTPANVTETSGGNRFALNVFAIVFEDIFQIVYGTITCCFRTDTGTAIAEAFAGQYAIFEAAFQTAVFTKEVTDFTAANAHITSRNVDIRTDVPIQGLHIALAETHDFSIGFAIRIKVCAAFSAANRKTRQRVLENLFETEELNDTGIYVFLETETAFVWPDCAVELATVTGVRMDFTVVIFPDNAECKHPFRFNHTIQEIVFFVFRMTFYNRIQRRQYFFYGLDKFRFIGMFRFDVFDYRCKILVHKASPHLKN